MPVLQTIGFILLFILCISVLIIVHELGHLTTAKFFKVYCSEFSVGMGPALFKKKRKNGETYFSLRAIPFGGYVAMYDKGVELPEGVIVDESRQFSNIKKWKRVIVLFAGVFNNAILALFIFLISESCFAQKQMYLTLIDVAPDSVAEKAGVNQDQLIHVETKTVKDGDTQINYVVLDPDGLVHYKDKDYSIAVTISTQITSYDKRSFDDYVSYHFVDNSGNILSNTVTANDPNLLYVEYDVTNVVGQFMYFSSGEWILCTINYEKIPNPVYGDLYMDNNGIVYIWDNISWVKKDVTQSHTLPDNPKELDVLFDQEYYQYPHRLEINPIPANDNTNMFESIGISFHLEEYWNDFGTAVKNTFVDFGQSSTAIVQSIASLFYSRETWGQIGGIISIGVQTTSILQNMGWAKFLYVWGLISVNLAIVNLLPFPGLDGWQILVIVVEAIAHKDIPDRVKNIMSTIGLVILIAFMVIILFKDIIGLF